MDKTEILNEIKKLSRQEQIQIVEFLLDSLQSIDPNIEKAWAKEASRRLKNFQEGKTEAISGLQVEEELRSEFAKKDD